jgi:1,6-anhydro-N-acetylmuramate kinase
MAIRFHPAEMLRKIAPKRTVERLVTQRLTLNRAAVTLLSKSEVLSKEKLETLAIKVIKDYRERFKEEQAAGASKVVALEEAVNGKRKMVQRVQNAVVNQIAKEIHHEYRGEYYIWLPSEAVAPDPLHQLNYGKTFQIGKGEMPGDRYGCQCGMKILVDDEKLEL